MKLLRIQSFCISNSQFTIHHPIHYSQCTAAHSPLKSGKISITRLTSEFGPVCFFARSSVSVFLLPPPGFPLTAHRSGQIRFPFSDSHLQICIRRFLSSNFSLTIFPSACCSQSSTQCSSSPTSTSSLTPQTSPLPRKEVIQPHLPVRLPCYDFVPVINPTLGSSFPKVRSPTSGVINSHDVTGGVYKARERIQRSMADLRLLATPTSCRRVAAYNPNYDRL
jgi:hypothetical protein